MHAARVDGEFAFVAGRQPAGVHEERVIEQRVHRAHGEERGRHAMQPGEDRRNIGVAPTGRRCVTLAEPAHDFRVEDEVARAPGGRARRLANVVDAEHEVRAGPAGVAVAVAHAEEGDGGEVRASRSSTDEQAVAAELGLGVLQHPGGGVFTVVRARGVGVFRREAVIDADHREAHVFGYRAVADIAVVGPPEHPAAAMDIDVNAPGRSGLRGGDAYGDFPATPRRHPCDSIGVGDDGSERAFPLLTRGPCDGRRDGVGRWHGREQLFELFVEGGRLRIDGGREKEGGVGVHGGTPYQGVGILLQSGLGTQKAAKKPSPMMARRRT